MITLDKSHFLARFVARAMETPDKMACVLVIGKSELEITNQCLLARALEFAGALPNETELPKKSVVPILLSHGLDLYASFIGVALTGRIPTLLPPLTSKQDPAIFIDSMRVLLERLGSKLIVSSDTLSKLIEDNSIFVLNSEAVEVATKVHIELIDNKPSEATEIAFLQHSSGTTGYKKGVTIPHNKIVKHAYDYSQSIGLLEDDVIASWLPIYHDMGLITSFLTPIITGNCFVAMDAIDWSLRPDRFLTLVGKYKANFAWFPDFAFNHTVRMHRKVQIDLSSLKMLVNCSEPCRRLSMERFLAVFRPFGLAPGALRACYAMAENVFAVTQSGPLFLGPNGNCQEDSQTGSVEYVTSGRTIDGVGISIQDPEGKVISDGEIGEIWITGEFIAGGYYNLDTLTAERFQNDQYRTGDLGFIEKGDLFVVGRLDDVLNINGKKIIGHEVESSISMLAGVAPGRVIAFSTSDIGQATNGLGVLFELADQDTASKQEIHFSIEAQVASSTNIGLSFLELVPRGFLVKSTSGKLSRSMSLKKFLGK